jgi:8-oxo-dGTP pyrophosphatase MutT (NUDIX family)
MLEELGVLVKVERPLWFVENFYEYAGQSCHEIALYFLMHLPAGCKYLELDSFQGYEEVGYSLPFAGSRGSPKRCRGCRSSRLF